MPTINQLFKCSWIQFILSTFCNFIIVGVNQCKHFMCKCKTLKKGSYGFFTYCLFLSFISVFKEIRILRRLLSFQGRTTFIKRQIYIYCKWLIQFAHINTCTCFNVTLAIYRYLYTLDDRTVSLLSLRINISKHKIYCLLFFWIGINTCHDVLFYVWTWHQIVK